ncbi:hypothetical protein GOV13_02200 [Candidatus Pacearchaeota archaeon]|nr:hypothetical protein [Candidatus Pacearchaeota archaeon]
MKRYLQILVCLIGMFQSTYSVADSYKNNILKNQEKKGLLIKSQYPYMEAINNNYHYGVSGVNQEDRVMLGEPFEEFKHLFRICGGVRDKSPYAIIFPREGLVYFRKSVKDPWKKADYSLEDYVLKYFPGCD